MNTISLTPRDFAQQEPDGARIVDLLLEEASETEFNSIVDVCKGDFFSQDDRDEVTAKAVFYAQYLHNNGLAEFRNGRDSFKLLQPGIDRKKVLVAAREPTLYNDSDKEKIIKYIETAIDPKGKMSNGYINTRYASKEAVPGKGARNLAHEMAFYQSISAKLVNTGKYIREKCDNPGNGYDILLNPAYFYNEAAKSHNKATRTIALVAAGISLLSFMSTAINSCNKEAPQTIILQVREKDTIALTQPGPYRYSPR